MSGVAIRFHKTMIYGGRGMSAGRGRHLTPGATRRSRLR